MTIPTYEQAMLPVLRVLADGNEYRRAEIVNKVVDDFDLTEEERGKMRWVQPNPAKPQEDLKAKDYEDVKKDYAEWAADEKNAEEYAIERDYPGY